MALSQDLKEFLSLLVKHEVEFMLVGAHAVAFHGYSRATEDIDFWIRREVANARKVLAALEEFGFGSLGLREEDLLDPVAVIQLGRAPNRIDLLTFLTGVEFDDCFGRSVSASYGNQSLPIISLQDLLVNKRATGRPKDLVDVDEFERSSAGKGM